MLKIQLHKNHSTWKTKIQWKHFCHKIVTSTTQHLEVQIWIEFQGAANRSAPSCRGQEQNNIRALHLQQKLQPVIYGFIKFIVLCHHIQGFHGKTLRQTKKMLIRIFYTLYCLVYSLCLCIQLFCCLCHKYSKSINKNGYDKTPSYSCIGVPSLTLLVHRFLCRN